MSLMGVMAASSHVLCKLTEGILSARTRYQLHRFHVCDSMGESQSLEMGKNKG